jgi:hypothetical protein
MNDYSDARREKENQITKAIYDVAESHWPRQVNRDRTKLIIVRPMVSTGMPPAKLILSEVALEPEPVGDFEMAYDSEHDVLCVWDPQEV